MKLGTIELTQGAVVYLVLMVVVIFVGVMIVTKGQLTITDFFEQKKLSELFDPGKLSIEGQVSADCRDQNNEYFYTINFKGITFTLKDPQKKEGDTVKFYLEADIGDRMFKVTREVFSPDADIFTCTKQGESFGCGQPQDLTAKITTPQDYVSSSTVVHLTAWRATEGVKDIINGPAPTFATLIDNQFAAYLGSVDLKGHVYMWTLCKENICRRIEDDIACAGATGCYLKREWLSAVCKACNTFVTSCSTFGSEQECDKCDSVNNLNCQWQNGCKVAT